MTFNSAAATTQARDSVAVVDGKIVMDKGLMTALAIAHGAVTEADVEAAKRVASTEVEVRACIVEAVGNRAPEVFKADPAVADVTAKTNNVISGTTKITVRRAAQVPDMKNGGTVTQYGQTVVKVTTPESSRIGEVKRAVSAAVAAAVAS